MNSNRRSQGKSAYYITYFYYGTGHKAYLSYVKDAATKKKLRIIHPRH
ncbi:hypothetical protein ACQKGD_02720 [Peribacillus frigoritolerans]